MASDVFRLRIKRYRSAEWKEDSPPSLTSCLAVFASMSGMPFYRKAKGRESAQFRRRKRRPGKPLSNPAARTIPWKVTNEILADVLPSFETLNEVVRGSRIRGAGRLIDELALAMFSIKSL